MDSQVKYLLSLRAIRERAKIVGNIAKSGGLNHFNLHEDRLGDVVEFVTSIIKVCDSIKFQITIRILTFFSSA